MNNPFFNDYKLSYDAVPFSKFETKHFIPAVEESIKLAINRIKQITTSSDKPNFEGSIANIKWPAQYTRDKDIIVLYLPKKISEIKAPNIGKK